MLYSGFFVALPGIPACVTHSAVRQARLRDARLNGLVGQAVRQGT